MSFLRLGQAAAIASLVLSVWLALCAAILWYARSWLMYRLYDDSQGPELLKTYGPCPDDGWKKKYDIPWLVFIILGCLAVIIAMPIWVRTDARTNTRARAHGCALQASDLPKFETRSAAGVAAMLRYERPSINAPPGAARLEIFVS